ncbi:MAG TPA: alpha/beta fold hydrolase [Dehalococcoidia bacterium]|nr:alpha/beta fold hydrolase [Dehalococcoidia bacterium]
MKRSVLLTVEGIDILGELYLPEEGKTFPALCICHGIPSGKPADPADRGYPLLAEKSCHAGFITLIFNFRGTGISGGNFDLQGWVKDLEAAIDYLYSCPEVERSQLCLMGFSGGAAVSTYVAAHDPRVTEVILCACPAEFRSFAEPERVGAMIEDFRRIKIIRDKDFPPSLDEWLKSFQYITPIQWIDKVAPRPLLILHGEKDDLVGVEQAWRLYEKAREPKEIAIIKGGEHKLRLSEKAMDTALEWLKKRVN